MRPRWNNVKINLYQCCFNVASTSNTDAVSTLCNIENLTLILFHFKHWINVISMLIHNTETTLIWRGNFGWLKSTYQYVFLENRFTVSVVHQVLSNMYGFLQRAKSLKNTLNHLEMTAPLTEKLSLSNFSYCKIILRKSWQRSNKYSNEPNKNGCK